MDIFCDVTIHLADIVRSLRGSYCLYLQDARIDDEGSKHL